MSCFPKPLKEEDNDEEAQQRPSTKASSQKSVIHNPQYEAVLKNIRTQELKVIFFLFYFILSPFSHPREQKDFQQLRMMAFRRRSLLKKPGLNENLRLWLSIEVGELASFDEKQLKRVVSGMLVGKKKKKEKKHISLKSSLVQKTQNKQPLKVRV